MIKLGIIGFGDMGKGHFYGFNKISGCQVIAIADPDESQLKLAQKSFIKDQLKTFTDYRDLLKISELDAVIIATPNFLHARISIDALNANKDVFLEKPIATDIEATDSIIESVAQTDRIVQVGLVYRYANLYRTMAHIIEKGSLGKILMAYCKEYRDNFPSPWYFDEAKSGGAILEKNCHHFDLFNWFIGSSPKRVFAMGGQHTYKTGHKIQCSYSPYREQMLEDPTIVDHANILIEYENGAKANLGLCMYEIHPIEGLEIGIMGNNGIWALAKNDSKLTIAGGPFGEIKEIKVDYYSDNQGIGHIGCQTERREFIKCITTREQPYANLSIAREACVISLAAEISIKEERIVNISEFYNPEITAIFRKLGYEQQSITPPIFTLDEKRLRLKQKRELKIKERELKRELAQIKKKIDNL
jgi:predicted dehydrogenase